MRTSVILLAVTLASCQSLHPNLDRERSAVRKDRDGVWRCVVDIWNELPLPDVNVDAKR